MKMKIINGGQSGQDVNMFIPVPIKHFPTYNKCAADDFEFKNANTMIFTYKVSL